MRTAVFALSLLLIACNSGSAGLGDDGPTNADEVKDLCEERADEVVVETLQITFEATGGGCAWGEDGNLEAMDGYLTARVEQVERLDLEEVVVCDMDFGFAGEAGLEQEIRYDDNFLFTFNDVVLAASYGPWVDELPEVDGLRQYVWDDIAGLENLFDNTIPTYCLGEEAGLAECDIPPPETVGPISLGFDLDITSKLSALAINEGRYDFGFIATGDNDPDTDCSHEEFYMEVEVPYLE